MAGCLCATESAGAGNRIKDKVGKGLPRKNVLVLNRAKGLHLRLVGLT